MSQGATLPYHQRQNKHVERHLFVDILRLVERWNPLRSYLYVGFGGIYFEDFKLLHDQFGIDKMISLEQEAWMLPRQEVNLPYGCIAPRHETSAEFIRNIEASKVQYPGAANYLIWLDYVVSKELPNQLDEVRALVPRLNPGDILKVTIPGNPRWLNKGSGSQLENRLDNLKNRVGSAYLAEGLTEGDVRDDALPAVLLGALKRKLAEAMAESPAFAFQPLGCYVYRDSVTMLTATGIVLDKGDIGAFLDRTHFRDFELASPDWALHSISVPDLSLREKLVLDKLLFRQADRRSAAEIGAELGFQFEEDGDESAALIESYIKFYRYYPNYHRVQL